MALSFQKKRGQNAKINLIPFDNGCVMSKYIVPKNLSAVIKSYHTSSRSL